MLHDVGRAAGVHRGNGHAERARFEQHAAERLGTARREDEQRRVREPGGRLRLIDPSHEPHVAPDASGLRLDRGAIGTVADDHERPVEARALDDVDQVRGAFVGRELAEVERVRTVDGRRRRPRPSTRRRATSTGLGMISSRVAAISGARARRSAAIVVLTAMMASAAARPERLRARLARMYGIIGSASGQSGAGARPDAARHHARRASGTERRALARVDQVGPVADGPVVANGADGGAAMPVRGRRSPAGTSARAGRARDRRASPSMTSRERVASAGYRRSFLK